MNLDDFLTEALRREQPSAGFAGRVLAAAAERKRRRMLRTWTVVAAMFACGAVITAEVRSYEQHRQVEAREAGHQLAVALRITGSKLHATTRMMRRRSNGV